MGQILAVLQKILGIINTVLGIVGVIQGQTSQAAQENAPFEIDTATQELLAIATDSTFGNAALQSLIAANQATITSQLDDMESTLATLQASGIPVTLPVDPPPGYGGPDAGTIADSVWERDVSGLGDQAASMMTSAGIFAMYVGGSLAVPWGADPKLLITGGAFWNPLNGPPSIPPTIRADERNILPADTLLTWLNRETGFVWSFNDNGYAGLNDFDAGTNAAFPILCAWTPADFAQQQASVAAAKLPPVWTGVANQTYHGLTPFSDSGVLVQHCHGVIVLVTEVPFKQGKFSYGTFTSWRNIGSLAFITDDGEAEPYQLLGFDSSVYLCRTMVVAESVAIHLEPGVTISVIPFTIDGS